jgi:hypothetical protein
MLYGEAPAGMFDNPEAAWSAASPREKARAVRLARAAVIAGAMAGKAHGIREAIARTYLTPQEVAEGDWGKEGESMASMIRQRINDLLKIDMPTISRAAVDVMAERERHDREGFTAAADDRREDCDLALAGAAYVYSACKTDGLSPPDFWPFPDASFHPTDKRQMLIKGMSLILAEIEKIDRAEAEQL